MAYQSLKDLYVDQLRDLYDAEQQISQAMPKMIKASSSPDLRQTFQKHLDETKYQIERLDLIFKKLGEPPRGKRCRGIEGIIAEGNELMQAGAAPDVADAALIASAQRVEHYEIAGYGCVRTFAERLEDEYSADLLQKTLDEEEAADLSLTDLAEAGINQSAGSGTEIRGSRLTYVAATQLSGENASLSDVKVMGAGNDDLGRVDGFVMDRASGRPYYVVVDSGGWFTGNRYLLPINSVQFNRRDRQMRISMDKETIKRYPTFDGDAFEHADERGREYESRLLEAYGRRTDQPVGATWNYEQMEEFHQPDWWITEGVSVTRPSERHDAGSRPSASAAAARDRGVGPRPSEQIGRPASEGRSTVDEPHRGETDRDRNKRR